MFTQFKPGDIVSHPECGRGIVHDAGWVVFADDWDSTILSNVTADLRRLVVIDPEDREQVERLLLAYGVVDSPDNLSRCIPRMQAALLEFADPKPPKPEEPTGLGAVVEDADGTLWVRSTWPENDDDHLGKPWSQGPVHRNWLIVDAVRVLSEGVQP